jgi:hypothetical protein
MIRLYLCIDKTAIPKEKEMKLMTCLFLLVFFVSGCDIMEEDSSLVGTNPKLYFIYRNKNDSERMYTAIAFRDHVMIKNLVEEKHFDVNADIDDALPLCTAVYYGDMEMVQYFLQKGADINGRIRHASMTPLWTAIWKGRVEIALYLLEQGADPSIRPTGRKFSLCQYAKNSRSRHPDLERVIDRLPGCREAEEEVKACDRCSTVTR